MTLSKEIYYTVTALLGWLAEMVGYALPVIALVFLLSFAAVLFAIVAAVLSPIT